MARSNKELIDLALALGGELGVAVATDGLKNDGLEALVSQLEAQKAGGAPAPSAAPLAPSEAVKPPFDGAGSGELGGPPAPEAAPVVLPKGTVSVAPGISIICLRGHLDAGTVVTAADFGVGKAGDEQLSQMLGRGALVKS